MTNKVRSIFAFVFATSCFFVSYGVKAQPFDNFLNGFQQECNFGKAFSDFTDSLVQRVFQRGQTRLPSDLRAAFGAARITRLSDQTDVFVPLSGATWRGLPLSGLQFYWGNENGINVSAVVFAASAQDVRRVFGPTVAASARAMKNDPQNESEATISLHTTNGRPSIVCDLST